MKRVIEEGSFECSRCGTCCRWPGYVRLKGNESEKIAEFLGISTEEFTDKFTIVTEDRKNLSIIEGADGACIFLNEQGCSINSVKPDQCRKFPYSWNFFGWRNQCDMVRKK